MKPQQKTHELAITTIRMLAAQAVQAANSGHPGMPLGAAPMGYTLFKELMNFDPNHPYWDNRDRFVLSAGHGSMLQYALLHLFGYPLSMDDLKNFRQWGSKTPGHPEFGHTVGVEMTTGPLGQGLSSAVGMAMAETMLAAEFNRPGFPVVDHYTYVIAGDGDLMEGITSEASSLAGHLKLGKLIVLYDDNSITIDGKTDITFTEDVKKRYLAYGWQVLEVASGEDTQAILSALRRARRQQDKPTLIKVKTVIGFGAPHMAGTSKVHGAPLGEVELAAMQENLHWTYPPFTVPQEVQEECKSAVRKKARIHKKWDAMMAAYEKAEPELFAKYEQWMRGKLLKAVDTQALYETDQKKFSTRKASQSILNQLAPKIPNLVGGSADLAGSNLTYMQEMGDYSPENRSGRNIRFGVREHAMAAIVNGMTLHGGLKAFGSTFLIFSDYLKPSLRLSALMGIGALYIFTHDSIAVGEDGPTHQPIEQLPSLQMIPNHYVFRPCDYREACASWIKALEISTAPCSLVLSRQDLPILEGTGMEAEQGGYVLVKEQKDAPDLILMGSGSEVQHLVAAQETLLQEGIDARVVSMPCLRLFQEQPEKYKEAILPKAVKVRIAMEAGLGQMWAPFLGKKGEFIGLDTFGASAPGDVVMARRGITPAAVVERAKHLVGKNK
ncbi:Transketolase [Clostridiaceae bacterium JG1575]|nr:Transketolase [Clostridiaceae bacterium JG1575]